MRCVECGAEATVGGEDRVEMAVRAALEAAQNLVGIKTSKLFTLMAGAEKDGDTHSARFFRAKRDTASEIFYAIRHMSADPEAVARIAKEGT